MGGRLGRHIPQESNMIDVQPESFSVDIIGDATGEQYKGVFKVKPILTQNEQLARDELARTMLGLKSQEASPRANSQAYILAEIRIRTVDMPAFWKECKEGGTLLDENVMGRIYDKIQETEALWREKKKTEAAQKRGELANMQPLSTPAKVG